MRAGALQRTFLALESERPAPVVDPEFIYSGDESTTVPRLLRLSPDQGQATPDSPEPAAATVTDPIGREVRGIDVALRAWSRLRKTADRHYRRETARFPADPTF